MATALQSHTTVLLALTRAISTCRTMEDIYQAAFDALAAGLGVERSSILLFDPDGVMRFKACCGLSEAYRRALEGHSFWQPDTPDPQPIVIADARQDAALAAFEGVFQAEGISGMTCIPLVSLDRVIGKVMLYDAVDGDDLALAGVIAAQVACAVERTRTEEQARRGEEQLRFALDAALMGTWDWDLTTNAVKWSDNLERIHGLNPGTFDGTFASYEKEIHPDDRERVLASISRALSDGVPHDVEYRIVDPSGTVRWCEGKGRVEWQDGRPVRMAGVCMMITRRKEAELARLAAAEESNRLKDEFLATLSHELRTPLNAILGWVSLLEGGTLAADRAGRAIDVIGRNARLQAQLIEDVLDISRIIAGKLEIERVPLAVPALVDTVVAGAAPDLAAKRTAFELQVDPDLAPVEGDRRRLHQVLNNVLSNAIKFTPEDGSIRLACTMRGSWLEIQVQDSGAGIAPAFLPFVFERFRQADSHSTRRHQGLGLGLAIARHLVEQHGGEIRAESEGPGCGATITIRLPAAAAPAWRGQPAPAPLAEEVQRLDGLVVLVVDDQADSREVVARLLERRGAAVRQCESAAAALHVLATEAIQALVADIAMPELDGYELIRRVRAGGNRVPAVAVTATARPGDRKQALASGYAEFCRKPVDGASLAGVIRRVIAASEG